MCAERLGYHRVWVLESPAAYGDLWVALARIAQATERIGLATGVAIPGLRHPMVTASAIGSVHELAPGRLAVAFGTGYTGRITLGQRPVRWAEVARYVRQVRALLHGELAEVDGQLCQMMHEPGFAPAARSTCRYGSRHQDPGGLPPRGNSVRRALWSPRSRLRAPRDGPTAPCSASAPSCGLVKTTRARA